MKLHTKLGAFLLATLLVLAAAAAAFMVWNATAYEMEGQQTLHRDLASNIVAMKLDDLVGPDGTIQTEGLDTLFHWLMVVNPDVELYVTDVDGRLLAWDAPPGVVVRDRIDLGPVHRALAPRDDDTTILGDDPRHSSRHKVFSVAPIPSSGPRAGYLYVILASQQYDSVVERVRSSLILSRSLGLVGLAFVLAGLAGFVYFRGLTRPLRRLARQMRDWRGDDEAVADEQGDEVQVLRSSFESMRDRIERQMGEIQAMEASKRELIASVSHDLRTPIASVQGYLETLVMKHETLPTEERERYLGIALRQAERLAKLVAELFELAKLETGHVEPQIETFSLAELVQDNLQRYSLQAQNRGVMLDGDMSADLPPIEADLGLIDRALQNLIENALRFTPSDGKVAVELSRSGDRVAFEISDTGCGIEADELPHIFERFYRCQFAQANDPGGAGLGLAITKRIVDLHSGEIEVKSRVGEGTTFRVSLPAS